MDKEGWDVLRGDGQDGMYQSGRVAEIEGVARMSRMVKMCWWPRCPG